MANSCDQIYDFIRSLEVIDTHEHLPGREELREQHTDVLREYLSVYFNSDLISAGLPRREYQRVIDPEIPLMVRWRIVEPFWESVRYTGYGRALDIAVKEIYGVDGVRENTIESLNGAFQTGLSKGHFERVLKQKCRIRVGILDADLDCDRNFFRSAYRIDQLIYPRTMRDIEQVSGEAGMAIRCFDEWLEACRKALHIAYEKGAVCLKCAIAYIRNLYFERTTRDAAESEFNSFFSAIHYPDGDVRGTIPGKALQDYTMHLILQEADSFEWTIQIHTGLLEGNGNYIANGDPVQLSNLLLEYPQVKFDLFHLGYPYQQTAAVLAKSFPNAFLDMCWGHIISPSVSTNTLYEWIDSVPLNKISAFGGDYFFVDAIYGHLELARQNISSALARKVDEGIFGVEKAKEIARMLFVDNPARLFCLE